VRPTSGLRRRSTSTLRPSGHTGQRRSLITWSTVSNVTRAPANSISLRWAIGSVW
jgi:hypothetical protein